MFNTENDISGKLYQIFPVDSFESAPLCSKQLSSSVGKTH